MAELLASKSPSHRNSERRRNEVVHEVEAGKDNEEAPKIENRRGETLYFCVGPAADAVKEKVVIEILNHKIKTNTAYSYIQLPWQPSLR